MSDIDLNKYNWSKFDFKNSSGKVRQKLKNPVYLYNVEVYKKLFKKYELEWMYPVYFSGTEYNISPYGRYGRIKELKADTELNISNHAFGMGWYRKIYEAYTVSVPTGNKEQPFLYGFIYLLAGNEPQVIPTIVLGGKDKNVNNNTKIYKMAAPKGYKDVQVTCIRFIDGEVLTFAAPCLGVGNGNRIQEVIRAFSNAKNQGLDAFMFMVKIWSPEYKVDEYFSLLDVKPSDLVAPRELVLYNTVEGLDITPSMKEKFAATGNFDKSQAATTLLADKVFGISTTGVLEKIFEKTMGKTKEGKLLVTFVKALDMFNDVKGIADKTKKAIKNTSKVEVTKKLIMYGFMLPEQDSINFFETISLYTVPDITPIRLMTFDQIMENIELLSTQGSEHKEKAEEIASNERKKQMKEGVFNVASLIISVILF